MTKSQINLPKTAFSMKANLPTKEPEILNWEKINLYDEIRKSSKGKENLFFTMVHHMQMATFIWVLHLIKF